MLLFIRPAREASRPAHKVFDMPMLPPKPDYAILGAVANEHAEEVIRSGHRSKPSPPPPQPLMKQYHPFIGGS